MTKTINDVYMQLFRRLKEGGDPMPQLTAREITAYACKADKKQTAGWSHFYVEDATVDYAGLLCDRCLDGEPLAYIIGEWDFYGLTFKVDRSVLIPRSDTERLCELVIEQAKERVSPRILDLCCGSGCIGIAAAHTVEDARVTAIDLSDGALHITRENARDLGVSSRLLTMKADVMHAPPRGLGQFDIIVSNPPYVTEDEMQMLDRSVADFEPHEALYGGETVWISITPSATAGVNCWCRTAGCCSSAAGSRPMTWPASCSGTATRMSLSPRITAVSRASCTVRITVRMWI